MLGERGDESALTLITSSLASSDQKVRSEAAAALANISGAKAVPSLIEYMKNSAGQADQEAVKAALDDGVRKQRDSFTETCFERRISRCKEKCYRTYGMEQGE